MSSRFKCNLLQRYEEMLIKSNKSRNFAQYNIGVTNEDKLYL